MVAPISLFPTPTPSRDQSQDVFDPAVEAFLDHFAVVVPEINAVAAAMNLNSTSDTSASSVAIGTGAKTFTVSASKSFVPGMFLVIADTAAPNTNYMICQVTSYSGTSLVVNSILVQGSGTIAAWTISLTSSYYAPGVAAGNLVQVDQTSTIWTRAATTTLGTSLNGALSDTTTTVTAFNGVAGVTYHVRCLGAGSITYHATNLIITQGLSDITTASGDTFDVEMMTATTCRIKNYISSARGQLLQVVTVAYTTSTSTTSATLVDTGLTASITPKYATSKILVLVDQTVSLASTSTATYVDVAVFRGATDIGRDYRVGGSVPVAFDHRTVSLSIFDSPATTSATTYKTQFASSIAGQSVEAQHANIRPSTITLMEIRQ